MTSTTSTTSKNGLDPKKLDGVIDAMRDVQTEGDRWELAESLKVLVPTGTSEFARIIDLATKEGVAGNLSANTLRLYRDTAARWPEDKRVVNVSFSAHREAMALPGEIDKSARMLADLVKTQGAGKVTVASVRKAVAIKQGKQPTARQSGGTTSTKGLDVLRDLEQNRGAELIGVIGNDVTDSARLDRLNAGLTKVIAHVEKLRAKAAAKATTKRTTPPASTPKVGKSVAKKADMRGL